jgi:predicted acylesterase/phospholipase RssA
VFGTSTGAIIASLIALGYSVQSIFDLYQEHVPIVMRNRSTSGRTSALKKLSQDVFKDATFEQVKTNIGIVATRWLSERPMIFKSTEEQAHGRVATFVPGFGVSIADAVRASCSAYPFFERTIVNTSLGEKIELLDGGYCANNPTLYAIADAIHALKQERMNIRVLNIGVGIYPDSKPSFIMRFAKKYLVSVQLLQKTLEINTQSMDQLRRILFSDIPTVRISDTFVQPEMATDLLEYNPKKLDILFQRGRESFSLYEHALRTFLL